MSEKKKTPWHLWVVGIITLLWNAFGGFDYTMTKLNVDWYMEAFTAEQIAYYQSLPQWFVVAWALSIWLSVAGSLLLLLKSRISTLVFVIALFSYGAALSGTFHFHPPPTLTDQDMIISGVILAVLVFECAYSIMMKLRGFLR
ncbi:MULTISPECIES: hypothetical protein [Ponticaulis]|uniref:hypothetical protein n=1 Tax=Ponticaulis TaxID=1123044 RepID=UPI0003B3E298|nr:MULTISPECIES: hypothetical protein [Ponticaulis]MAJ07876.1 hypothetical protein [Ponticaulis sp.]RPG18190.1 MAG: hypothetical protein CBC85_002875 [Hyphomonadaceae bacterium TMED125]HBH88683.1 hypothetical protein [Hyphomonadaceae bacterium]HBJ91572.1 hypothetical protein [Hyphomonadaceae bacterium]|tara:strand:- start:1708 stop:2136 length:429 start_codon:yes stop_codon:yes gene_type:complete